VLVRKQEAHALDWSVDARLNVNVKNQAAEERHDRDGVVHGWLEAAAIEVVEKESYARYLKDENGNEFAEQSSSVQSSQVSFDAEVLDDLINMAIFSG